MQTFSHSGVVDMSMYIMLVAREEEGPLTIFQIYAPDSNYSDEMSQEFYDKLQEEINKLPNNNKYMLLGDFNAKVGSLVNDEWKGVIGKFGLGEMNERGLELLQFCAINNVTITNTLFKHSEIRRITWVSPDMKTRNQIDYIIVQQKIKPFVKNSRSYNSADIGSDHSLVMVNIEINPKKIRRPKSVPTKYKVDKLCSDLDLRKTFQIKIGGFFEPLLRLDPDSLPIDEVYSKFVDATNKATESTVGFKRPKEVEGLPSNIESMCGERRKARVRMIQNPEQADAKLKYKDINN